MIVANTVLYLRPDERKHFDALKEELKDGWEIKEEKIEAEERPEELKMRSLMMNNGDSGVFQEALQGLTQAKKPENCRAVLEKLAKMPYAAAMEIFFSLGVRKLSLFLESVLCNTKTDEDLRAVMGLSSIRHTLLESNAEFTAAS